MKALAGLKRAALLLFVGFVPAHPGHADEFRGLWVDTFHAALRNATEVSALVANARQGHFNAVIVEVRKRGDAYYNSRFEPKATDVAAGFDPLAELIRRAHDTSAGPRLEVHAWIVTYNIWNNQSTLPSQANHPYRLHPDWLTRSFEGATWDGSNYAFDPGHPGVQEHTYQVALDLVSRYDIDGLHWDYVRYAGREWGYNDVAVARFNQQTGSTGKPALDDSAWMQWRRDQITGLVRRVYLSARALKPNLTVSAATITWTPSPTSYAQWLTSAAHSDVLQDWRGWMEEGVLDLNIPMAYFRQEQNAADWVNWSRFAKEHRYGRHLALGVGAYLNTISNSLVQMRSTRSPTPLASGAQGVVAYSYAVPAKDNVPRSEFLEALVEPTNHDPNPTPVFATIAVPPPMDWKGSTGPAGFRGLVRDAETGKPIEGALIEVCDPSTPLLATDAHGFFGLTKSPNQRPTLITSAPGYASEQQTLELTPGTVATVDFDLVPADPETAPREIRISAGASSALISWRTQVPTAGHVLYGLGGPCGPSSGVATDLAIDTNHTVFLSQLRRSGTYDPYEYGLRVVAWDDQRTNHSSLHTFSPAWGTTRDDAEARWTGSWTYVTNTPTSVGRAYRRAATVATSPTATLTWSAPIPTTGFYDVAVSLYFPSGASGSTAAPYEIESSAGKKTVILNQNAGRGAYRTIATNLHYAAGETAVVRLRNNTGASGGYVLADAVSWSFRPGQDPPSPGQLPEWWSKHFFGRQVDGHLDADADDYSNFEEYVFGANPVDANSNLAIRSTSIGGASGWQIRFFPHHSGRSYRLLGTAALDAPDWQEVAGVTLSTTAEGEGLFTDPTPTEAQQFYRIQVEIIP